MTRSAMSCQTGLAHLKGIQIGSKRSERQGEVSLLLLQTWDGNEGDCLVQLGSPHLEGRQVGHRSIGTDRVTTRQRWPLTVLWVHFEASHGAGTDRRPSPGDIVRILGHHMKGAGSAPLHGFFIVMISCYACGGGGNSFRCGGSTCGGTHGGIAESRRAVSRRH